jgi:hypothetical protein
MKVPTFKAKCSACSSEFDSPSLGDFSYGSFLFTGIDGTAFGVYHSSDSTVWDLVESMLSGELDEFARGRFIQETCATLADPIDNQLLVNRHVCPSCQSSNWEWWEGEKAGFVDVPEVTFARFLSLPESRQKAAILACIGESVV